MAHWKEMFNYPHLQAHDIQNGNEPVLTIRKVSPKTVKRSDGSEETVPFIFWSDTNIKPMELNKTNAKILEGLYSGDPDKWSGKKVRLYKFSGKFFGEMRTVIRFRDKVPQEVNSKPELLPSIPEWKKTIDYLLSSENKGINEVKKRFVISEENEILLQDKIMEADLSELKEKREKLRDLIPLTEDMEDDEKEAILFQLDGMPKSELDNWLYKVTKI